MIVRRPARAPWPAAALCLLAAPALAQPEAAPDEATLALGREVFLGTAEPACAVCHALADAGAVGEIGPDLDALAPGTARVHAAVSGGVGVMPAYGDVLAPEQIDAVAAYVAAVTGAAEGE